MGEFSYPETVAHRSLTGAVKTKKANASEGEFVAVAAIFFGGKRVNQKYFWADTRARARAAGYAWLHK